MVIGRTCHTDPFKHLDLDLFDRGDLYSMVIVDYTHSGQPSEGISMISMTHTVTPTLVLTSLEISRSCRDYR